MARNVENPIIFSPITEQQFGADANTAYRNRALAGLNSYLRQRERSSLNTKSEVEVVRGWLGRVSPFAAAFGQEPGNVFLDWTFVKQVPVIEGENSDALLRTSLRIGLKGAEDTDLAEERQAARIVHHSTITSADYVTCTQSVLGVRGRQTPEMFGEDAYTFSDPVQIAELRAAVVHRILSDPILCAEATVTARAPMADPQLDAEILQVQTYDPEVHPRVRDMRFSAVASLIVDSEVVPDVSFMFAGE